MLSRRIFIRWLGPDAVSAADRMPIRLEFHLGSERGNSIAVGPQGNAELGKDGELVCRLNLATVQADERHLLTAWNGRDSHGSI
jgi:hypothetical protein